MIAAERLAAIKAWRLLLPLVRPYHLSLGAIEAFDTIVVETNDGERTGFGEATYVNGYTDETIEGAWDQTRELCAQLAGDSIAGARRRLAPLLADAPFTASAFGTALDMLEQHAHLNVATEARLPLLALLQGETEEEIERDIDTAIRNGYQTLKIKVGFDAAEDLVRMQTIQRVNRGRCKLRLDANQGYSREDALRFAASLDPDSIELFEQPCAKEDWDSAVAVSRVSTVPMMLDESIYDSEDIERVAHLKAASFVKLKLVKAGSIDTLVRDLSCIRELGMEPVLGNGVATEISNWMEACAARGVVTNALESNGFLKPRRSIVARPLRFEKGAIVLEPGWTPQLDRAAVEAQSVAVAMG
jgi:o-succinylbenzoate synthase